MDQGKGLGMSKHSVKNGQTTVDIVTPILGQSNFYSVRQYGLYRYQIMKHVQSGSGSWNEVTVGPENTYAVLAEDLVDQIINEIRKGRQ